jgi:hypothetical protein
MGKLKAVGVLHAKSVGRNHYEKPLYKSVGDEMRDNMNNSVTNKQIKAFLIWNTVLFIVGFVIGVSL